MNMARREAVQQLLRATRALTSRTFSSAPEAVAETSQAEFVHIAQGAPVLVKLPDRAWGASAILPSHLLPSQAGNAQRVSVVRHAFASHDAEAESLSGLVAVLGEKRVAVHHDAAQPERRLIVDEYARGPDGQLQLQSTGADLIRFLRREGVGVSHVPDVGLAAQRALNSARASERGVRQSTNEVLMVAPTAFGFNDQAAQDNHFMHSSTAGPSGRAGGSVTHRALREFAGLHHELTEVAGVRVSLFQHSLAHGTPDAVFPNNWFTTHPAGEAGGGVAAPTLVFYPLKCPNRQMEKREDIKAVLRSRGYADVWDMSDAERQHKFFEGTGVLVLDRVNGVAYVNLSERAHADLAAEWVDRMAYKELVTFHTVDPAGAPVYHTNVMMAIGTDVAVVCAEAVADARERAHLLQRLRRHHKVVEISAEQMGRMCGNILELEDGRGLPVLAMSSQAHDAFTPEQRAELRRHVAALHHAPLDTIEYIGGGGVRCSLAELF